MSENPGRIGRSRRLLAEGVIIVTSILLAFAIDAAWETRGRRAAEGAVLADLLSEFARNQEALERARFQHERIEAAGVRLLDHAGRPALTDIDLDDVRLVFLARMMFNPTNSALDSYIASGNPELISNESLRALLAAWPAVLEDAAEDERRASDLLDQRLRPYLSARIPLTPVYLESSASYVGDFPVTELIDDLGSIFDLQGRNLITERIVIERLVVAAQSRLQQSLKEISELLEIEVSSK